MDEEWYRSINVGGQRVARSRTPAPARTHPLEIWLQYAIPCCHQRRHRWVLLCQDVGVDVVEMSTSRYRYDIRVRVLTKKNYLACLASMLCKLERPKTIQARTYGKTTACLPTVHMCYMALPRRCLKPVRFKNRASFPTLKKLLPKIFEKPQKTDGVSKLVPTRKCLIFHAK